MKEHTIYLGGGCFWGGLQAYIRKIKGVISTEVGYANGPTSNPTYEEVCHDSGHVEALKVVFDEDTLSLDHLIQYFLRAIDPFSINKQGGDEGIQYRTGIYYTVMEDRNIIDATLARAQSFESKPFAIEVLPLENYYSAEEYHQDYLDKNPTGYCHIPLGLSLEPLIDDTAYTKPTQNELETLTSQEYEVTQNAATDPPFSHELTDEFKSGIYVDITSGEPLFVSAHKFDSHCGWPSFTKPIAKDVIRYYRDTSHGMNRIEVRSRIGNAHLGHVFEDGPNGSLRYCINGSALRFIPKEKLKGSEYEYLLPYVED
nr:peptide-methionine (R)-S-oxide reductase MsrB [Veillonella denticariosi]